MTKPFLILQLRPEPAAADNELDAILKKGGLARSQAVRVRLDTEPIPAGFDLNDYSGIIVGGGPGCVSDPVDQKTDVEKRIEDSILNLMPAIDAADFPFLGCCYGIGILAHLLLQHGVIVIKIEIHLPRSLQLQQVPCDDDPLNLARPFADLAQLGVAHIPLDGEVLRVSVTTVNLDRIEADLSGHLRSL